MPKPINVIFLGSVFLVILAGVLTILYVAPGGKAMDELFSQYFEPYRTATNFGESQVKTTSFPEAMVYYQNADFAESANMLQAICSSDTSKAIHFFYLGNSFLALDKPRATKAKKAFRDVFKFQDGYEEASQWYLGLACLKNHEADAARNILWEVARKTSGFKQKEARKIVDKLLEKR